MRCGSLALRALALAVLLTAPAAGAVEAPGPGWARYVNPRFGVGAEYPASIFVMRDRPPDNGDGQGFRSRDGSAHLLIYGQHNALDDTPQSYVDSHLDLQGVEFRRVTARFFVVSGRAQGQVFYRRCNFPPDSGDPIGCLDLTYPAAEKARWDPIVLRISRSLSMGRRP